jgi:hypothetical protein
MPHDTSLVLPPLPSSGTPLHGPSDTLARADRARPRPFLLTAPGASARGIESRGIEGVECGGRLVLGRIEVRGASCGNVLLAPAQARRELVGRHGGVMEVLLLTPDGLASQWTPSGAPPASALHLALEVPGAAWRAEGPRFTAAASDGIRMLHVSPAPVWSVREEPGILVLSADVDAHSAPVQLLACAGDDAADAGARLARLARGGEARAEGDLVAHRTRGLAARTGVDELDDGLAWAAARLDAATGAGRAHVHDLAAGEPFPFDPGSRRAWTALGALAAGGRAEPPGSAGSELELLALARASAWRGTRMPADAVAWARAEGPRPAAGREVGTRAFAARDTTRVVSPDGARDVARSAALLALADATEPWQGKERAQELRAAATRTTPRAPAGARRLPTLGSSAAASATLAATLAAALDLPGRARFVAPAEDPPPGLLRALTAWACLNEGDVDRGFALYRRHLADGFAHGAGLWPDGSRIHDPAAAALVPLVFLEGLLGARGDAHYGRLRLAPRLPPHWTRLIVTGIGLRDARVRLEYELANGTHRFRIAQESGAVPVMLVFEPVLAISREARARVDGGAADVDVVPFGGRAQLRVQLPLDREREISIG